MRSILLVTCAALAVACGGSDNRPAQDGSSVSTTSSTTTSLPSEPSSSNVGTTSATMRAQPSSSPNTAPPMSDVVDPSPHQGAPPSPRSSEAAPAAHTEAAVSSNPGVADKTPNANNTKINDRDRHGALTPIDQGNSSEEIKMTAAVRKGVMSDKSLSSTAKNVKIITVGTTVTLRGPVNSEQEKSAIEALAKQTPGVTRVDNQLEVKK